ncbi:hypothetical protein FDA94_03290 [Herbidospora galbida]|uniref:Uncharacterized protein n=1 Tax=Herbidospora galbida TaxID=2575442 RepID=A0A4V5V141_9ACTN|nr:hypothetical protein [Herbidospora galbida]TKK90803.1 hypothetical protein FDA94_03290 [Herbidospora galbida]
MDAIALLDWLLECDVNAILRVDADRGGVRPWTFHATNGEWSLRVDAFSAEECLEKALKALAAHGLVPSESLT